MPKQDTTPDLRNNPYGDDFETMPDDGRKFVVLHTGVGSYRQGDTVTARHLGPGAELPRLVTLGAIRELSPSEAKDAEVVSVIPPNSMPIDAQFATGNPHTEPLGKPPETAPAAAPTKVNPPAPAAPTPPAAPPAPAPAPNPGAK